MGDPLFIGGTDWADVGVTGLKVLLAFVFLLVATMFMVWFERKVIADMQNRVGPNTAGRWGMLQTLADGMKFFFKEDNRPTKSDPVVFRLAPYLAVTTAFVTFAIVPVANGTISIFGKETLPQVADPPIGILLLLVMSSIAVYGVMLAGWGSGSKYPLLGSVRASAQAISYEAALGLSVVAVVLVAGTLSTSGIVAEQIGGVRNWNVLLTGIVPFVIFFIAGTAELNRPPFDLVEAEQELVGGFHTEYSSMRFAMFFLAEFMNVVTMSAIMVTLFFGGPSAPVAALDFVPGPIWFIAKVLVFLFCFVWFRATLPRIRYDQLMDLGWKVLIPAALGWLMVVALIRGSLEYADWNRPALYGGLFGLAVVSYLLLVAAVKAGNAAWKRENEEVV
ncbi:MAG: NADH-quinone oxidoreductase subunit NuoH [Acidimicrobiales bacterium]